MIKKVPIKNQKSMSFKKAMRWMSKNEQNITVCNGVAYFICECYNEDDMHYDDLCYESNGNSARVNYQLASGKWYKVQEFKKER